MDPTQNWLFHLCRITPEEIRLIQLSRGQVITDRLDGERQVALVCSGRVKVLAENANGGQLLVNQVGEGALFGVSNLLLEEELATSIQAQRQSLLAMVSKPLVIQRLRENPQAMERYARFLNGRIQFLLGRIRSLTPAPAQLTPDRAEGRPHQAAEQSHAGQGPRHEPGDLVPRARHS